MSSIYKERNKKIAEAKRMPTDEFVRRANEIHNYQYRYDNVVYINAHTKVTITCLLHGNWQQRPMVHLTDKCGCPHCGNIKKGEKKKESSYQKFLLLAQKKHNNKYSYVKSSYAGITLPMTIICPIHGEFKQSPDVHKRAGCQRCGSGPVSESSQRWLDSLKIPKENREKWIHLGKKRIKVDAYDPVTNTIFEYWGDYWHGNPAIYNSAKINSNNKKLFGQLYQETLNRITLIETAGFNLVQIWESEWLTTIDNPTFG